MMCVTVQCPNGTGTVVTGEALVANDVCDSVSTDKCNDVGAGDVCGRDDFPIMPEISAMRGMQSFIDKQFNDCWR